MTEKPNQTFTGQVYDLDFIQAQDWCQALLRKSNESPNIAVVTSDARMQSILEIALLMKHEVEVSYKDEDGFNRLNRVKLNIG
jgi:hypothetical protein